MPKLKPLQAGRYDYDSDDQMDSDKEALALGECCVSKEMLDFKLEHYMMGE